MNVEETLVVQNISVTEIVKGRKISTAHSWRGENKINDAHNVATQMRKHMDCKMDEI